MSKSLRVLMMGGQRVGKSSALAAMVDSFVNGKVSSILTAKDITTPEKKDGVRQPSINEKLYEAKKLLKNNVGKTILVDSGKTNIRWDYTLELTDPKSDKSMTIFFTDVNGEFFEGGNFHQEEITGMINDYDVFIIAVDTPFMMESRKNELVDNIINIKYNCTESIHTFLTLLDDKAGDDAKLVIFTPIKCEKWAQENKLSSVTTNLKEDYRTTLTALSAYKSVQVEIIPIQTLGSMAFQEHREANLFLWEKRKFIFFKKECLSKCSILQNHRVRLSDGTEKNITEGTLLDDDSSVLIQGTDIVRPNSWFNVKSTDYNPHNCEQLAFHILDFMLSKVIDAKVRQEENQNAFMRGLRLWSNIMLNMVTRGCWDNIKDIFGGISIKTMDSIICQIYDKNLIKTTGEGIEILSRCPFKKLKYD